MNWIDAVLVVAAIGVIGTLNAVRNELNAMRLQQKEQFDKLQEALSRSRNLEPLVQSIARSAGLVEVMNDHVFAIREHLVPGGADTSDERLLSAVDHLKRTIEKNAER